MLLAAQSIKQLCMPFPFSGVEPMIKPFNENKLIINGKSAGLSCASYDVRIDHDLTLGINPAIIFAKAHFGASDAELRMALLNNPPYQALAFTVEDFCLPNDVSGQVSDKSSYARQFVSAFNTFIDPGFKGNLTIELVNHGTEPVIYERGDPLVQILFTALDTETEKPYCGKYQHQTKAAHGPRHEAY